MELTNIHSKSQDDGLVPMIEDLLRMAKEGLVTSVAYVALTPSTEVQWGMSNTVKNNVAIIGAASLLLQRCMDRIEIEEIAEY